MTMEDIEMSSQGPTGSSIVDDTNLCTHCRYLLDHVHETTDSGRIFPLHQHIFALAGSVRKGCQLCSLFVSYDEDARRKWVNTVLEDGVLEPGLQWYSGRVNPFSFNSIQFGDNEGCWSLTFEFHHKRLCFSETISEGQDVIEASMTPPSGELPRQLGADEHCCKTENRGWKEIDDHWWPLYGLEKSTPYTWTLGNGVDLIPAVDSGGIKGTRSESALPPLQCVKQWFNTCLGSTCIKPHIDWKPAFSNFIPTRLIYLHADGPRLCLSKDMDFYPLYATLSYTDSYANYSKRTNLITATLPQFLEEVPPKALCKTFENAMIIAKHVGICYLWIDSICVLQDDKNYVCMDPYMQFRAVAYGAAFPRRTPMRGRPFTIGGIVEKIQSGADDVYMAGLWRSDIEKQLCWEVIVEDELAPPNRLPSWSWLSVDGSIEPRFAVASTATVFYIEVVGVNMKPKLSNACTAISLGKIHISYTYLIPCKLTDAELRQYSNRERMTKLFITPNYNMKNWRCHDDFLVEKLFFLPIFFNDGIEGIIIRPLVQFKLQFRRLGHFKLGEWPDETTSSKSDAVESLLREVGDIWYGRTKDGKMGKRILPSIIELV